jgi:hypothetical protein
MPRRRQLGRIHFTTRDHSAGDGQHQRRLSCEVHEMIAKVKMIRQKHVFGDTPNGLRKRIKDYNDMNCPKPIPIVVEELAVIVEIVRRLVNDRILAFVAAGPLEDLIRLHASTFIDRIEAVANGDEQFRKAVSGAWADELPTDIEQRLTRMIGDGPRL